VPMLGSQASIAGPLFLDDLQIAAPGNRPTNVDVQLWALYPTPSPYYRWYRIRSMGTCGIPKVALFAGPSRLDNSLRRYSLRNLRPQLQGDDVGAPMSVPAPNTSRIVEVLVEPLLPFEVSILTDGALELASGGAWRVDSYDSRDPLKSGAGGRYPGIGDAKVQKNATVASNAARPGNSPYGPLISARGCTVWGSVATNGGDDPSTAAHENVDANVAIDAARIRSDFYRKLTPLTRPTSGIFLSPPKPGEAFVAGSQSRPTQYLLKTDLGGFQVVRESNAERSAITIMVNGNLDIATGTIAIPEDTTVSLYVLGNVDFHDRPINAGGRPQQLQIYGEGDHTSLHTLSAFGAASISAAFYGPAYDVKLMDNVSWYGAVGARSFSMVGGGTGGFHYDEALNVVGQPIGFRVARYIEDARQ